MHGKLPHDYSSLTELLGARGVALGVPLQFYEKVGSTNDEAKAAAKSGAPHGALFLADAQTGGRGRQGRVWHSPRGENILASLVVRLPCPVDRLPQLSLVVGLVIADVIALRVTSRAVGLKWPNDVLVGSRKAAGILVEAQIAGSKADALIVGFGVNVHTREFPPDLAATATSIALESDAEPDRAQILCEILAALDRDLFLAAGRGLGPFRARIHASDRLRGTRVRNDAQIEGIANGIDDHGRLIVRMTEGEDVRWSSGEVHLVGRD